jgi:hypothetical protein
MRRSAMLVTVSALVFTLAPVSSVAHAVQPNVDLTYTADFESSATVHVSDQITNQYPFVTFDAFHTAGYGFSFGAPGPFSVPAAAASSDPIVTASGAHGGSNSGALGCGSEFCSAGTFGLLNYTADGLSVYAGDAALSSIPLELDAYDSDGAWIAHDAEMSSGTGASTLLSVSVPASDPIAYFAIYKAGAGNGDAVDIDDVSISVPSTAAPKVGVSAGAAGYELGQDGTINIPLTIHRINGAAGAVVLDVEGFTAKVTGSATDPGTGTTSTLTVSAAHTAPLTGVPLTISASAADAVSQPAVTVTITVIAPISFAAPTHLTSQTCESNTFTVEAQVAPGEPGPTVAFSTSFSSAPVGLTAHATSPITISSGLADTSVQLSNTGGDAGDNLIVLAELTNSDVASVSIAVKRQGPTITAVDAIDTGSAGPVAGKKASTPRAGQKGTAVEVYGHGFCNSATIDIGNDKAPMTGTVQHLSNGQGPYDYLRVTTPRLATTGKITVTAGSPAVSSAPSSQGLTVDSYRNDDAWNFQNFDPQLNFDDLTQAYGEDQTYLHVDPCGFFTLGLGHCSAKLVPDPVAEILLGVAQASMQDGTCFGFSLSSQRILEGDVALSSLSQSANTIYDIPKPDTSDLAEQVHGTAPVLDFLKSQHLMQLSLQFLNQWLGQIAALNVMPSNQVSDDLAGQITHIFAKGRYPLIEIQDNGGHVVVAYDIEQTGPSAYDIYVYDSNDQFTTNEDSDSGTHFSHLENSVIHLAADGSWSLASTTQSDGTGWHGGIGNLVVTDPAVIPVHPTLPSIGGAAPPGALFSSSGAPGTSRGAAVSAAKITQVSSGGRTLYTSTGVLNTNPSTRLDAAPFGPFVAAHTAVKKLNPLIAVAGSVHGLTVSTNGRSAGPTALSFVQGPYAAQVMGSTAKGAAQTESFSPRGGSVRFAGTSKKPVTLNVTRSTKQSEHSVAITLAHAGSADNLTLSSGKGAVTFTHSGQATSFTLTLSGSQSQGLPETFTSGPMTLGKNQTARLTSTHWGGLGGSTLTVQIGSRSVTLHNHTRRPAAATITKLHATTSHKHRNKVTLRVTAKLPRLPTGSRAFVIWLVHRGHHLIATHHRLLLTAKRTAHAAWTTKLAKHKHLTFTAVVVTIAVNGTAEESAKTKRSTVFAVP